VKSATHYHIQWCSDASLDWKPFRTKEEATNLAKAIKQPNETYIIAERDGECERCKEFKARALAAKASNKWEQKPREKFPYTIRP